MKSISSLPPSPAVRGTGEKAYPAPGHRVYNFGAGPATFPLSVLEEAREALADFKGLGAGVIEISHRSPEFLEMITECDALLRELMSIPPGYRVLYAHGGGQLQFSMVPFNLIAWRPARKALYIDTGSFASRAAEIAMRYGFTHVPGHSRETGYDRIPEFDPAWLEPDASYLHITTNNTAMGTRWAHIPDCGDLPLVGDLTSEILSRPMDVSRFGLIYAGAQKNLAPPGLAVVIIREDLMGHALPTTPKLMNYAELAKDPYSLTNTPTVLSLYMMRLMLGWMKDRGGVARMEESNEEKAARIYRILDGGGFYRGYALPQYRSIMNVTFTLADAGLLTRFLEEAHLAGLYALRGHGARGGVRASLYNAMPMEGVDALAAFITEFERRNG